MIPTRVHGVLDYLMGFLLVGLGAFVFGPGTFAGGFPIFLGLATIVYSLLTRYELGALHVLPMRTHLILDAMSGLLLAASPWMFGFADRVWWPHLLLGLTEVLAAALTVRVSKADREARTHGRLTPAPVRH
jgi:hypothetical protein